MFCLSMAITFWNSMCQCFVCLWVTFWNSTCQLSLFVCLWVSLSEILHANVLLTCGYHFLTFYVPMFCLPVGISFWNSMCQCFVCLCVSLSENLCANVLFTCGCHFLKFHVPMFCLPVGITFWNSTCQCFVCLWVSLSEILCVYVLFACGYHFLKFYMPIFWSTMDQSEKLFLLATPTLRVMTSVPMLAKRFFGMQKLWSDWMCSSCRSDPHIVLIK